LEESFLGLLGFSISVVGAVYAGAALGTAFQQMKEADQLGEQVIGVGLDGLGIAAGLAELGA